MHLLSRGYTALRQAKHKHKFKQVGSEFFSANQRRGSRSEIFLGARVVIIITTGCCNVLSTLYLYVMAGPAAALLTRLRALYLLWRALTRSFYHRLSHEIAWFLF